MNMIPRTDKYISRIRRCNTVEEFHVVLMEAWEDIELTLYGWRQIGMEAMVRMDYLGFDEVTCRSAFLEV